MSQPPLGPADPADGPRDHRRPPQPRDKANPLTPAAPDAAARHAAHDPGAAKHHAADDRGVAAKHEGHEGLDEAETEEVGMLDDLGEADRFDPEELRRYEEERAARRRRRDALARPVVGFVVGIALAFLAYDSLVAMGEAREDGEPWAWDAVVAAGCLAGVAVLVLAGIRRVRR